MLNRNNKGEVCYGVDDNGDGLGLTIGTKILIDVKERIKILVNPAILPKVIDVKTDDGKACIRVTAEGTSIPYSCDGRYFIRNCASDDKIDQEVLIQMVESNVAIKDKDATEKLSYIDRGTLGMATAGSGDVLSGIITGLLGYIENEYDATVAAAYINGLAREPRSKKNGRNIYDFF